MDKLHYHLVSGVVIFRDPEAPNAAAVGEMRLNTTLRSDSQYVPARQIGKAQQSLQMLMYTRLDDTSLEVVDVHINSISYLGEMTEEDFMEAPEGMTLQEQVGGPKSN